MSTFTDFLADKTAGRLVLVELTTADHGTVYIGSETFVTGPGDTPANTIYDGILVSETVIERRLSGPMGLRGGAANVSDLVVANTGDLDDWLDYIWQTATVWYGDASWSIATIKANGKRGEWKVRRVEANDLEIRFELFDRYEDLREPIQATIDWRGANFGDFRPLCYGYPKNVTPVVRDQDSTPVFSVHEGGTVEDTAATRYINQKASTSPAITKFTSSFGLGGDPSGVVTADIKGIIDESVSPETWLTTMGECLKHALTRSHSELIGFALGGSATTVVLDASPRTSTVDDTYNAATIGKGVVDDPAQDDTETKTISDYDGATRTVTISGSFSNAAVAGDAYGIGGFSTQYGPLTTSDLDTDAFDALDVALPYEIGLWLANNESGVDMLDMALAPAGYHCWTPAAKLTVGLLADPTTSLIDNDLSSWSITMHGGCTVTANAATAPDGTMTAYELTRDNDELDGIGEVSEDIVVGDSYRVDLFLKNNDSTAVHIDLRGKTGPSSYTSIGSIVVRFTDDGFPRLSTRYDSPVDIRIIEADEGYGKVSFSVVMGAYSGLSVNIRPAIVGSDGDSVYVWGLKVYKAPALILTEGDIQDGPDAIEVVDIQHPVWRMRVGYDKNHTVANSGVAGTIDAARMAWVVDEYRYQSKVDWSILEDDPNARDVEIPTVFTAGADARDERDRYWSLFSVPRRTVMVRAFTEPMGANLGDVVEVIDPRHGMASGKRYVLIGILEDLANGLTELELWG